MPVSMEGCSLLSAQAGQDYLVIKEIEKQLSDCQISVETKINSVLFGINRFFCLILC